MTDRDTFAAAALTGLLSNVQRYQNGPVTQQAYELADFMLIARNPTSKPSGVAGNTEEPAAWAVTMSDGSVYEAFAAHQKGEAEVLANESRFGDKSRPLPLAPLYLRSQPTFTTEEREAIDWCVELLDVLDSSKADTLRGLLERTK
jgi:hypothetical protein